MRNPREKEKYGEMLSNLLEYYTEYSTGHDFQSDPDYIKYAGERIQTKWDWAELLEDITDILDQRAQIWDDWMRG